MKFLFRFAAQVLKINTEPILSKKSMAKQKEVYPHVYDSQSVTKSKAGIFTGGKVLLPENVERIDNKMYEEVVIPVNPKAPEDVGKVLIPIENLDEVRYLF